MPEITRRQSIAGLIGAAALALPGKRHKPHPSPSPTPTPTPSPSPTPTPSPPPLRAVAGDNLNPGQYGGGTYAQAVANWQAVTGRTLAAHRYYIQVPPAGGTVPAALQADAAAARFIALSFKPSTDTGSAQAATDRGNIAATLANLKALGAAMTVTIYHEPAAQLASTATYAAIQAFYGPAVQAYYPLNYCGMASTGAGTVANYQAYYSAARAAGVTFQAAAVDHYCSAWSNGVNIVDYAAVTDPDGLAFGVYEFGANESVFTDAQVTAFYAYLQAFLTNREAAGLGVGAICHFTANPPGPLSSPSFMTCRPSQLTAFDALYDAVS